MKWDVFICYAGEDIDAFVEPLAETLRAAGLRVWYAPFLLKLGDSLRQKIDEGLREPRHGIVVLSPTFFGKNWPNWELDGLVDRQMKGQNVILPVWHNVSHDDVAKYSPPLAGLFAIESARGIDVVVREVVRVVKGEDAAAQYDKVGPVRRLLRSKAAAYPRTHELLSPVEMSQLYLVREHVAGVSQAESLLLLHSNLAVHGPAWFWHRHTPREQYLAICREGLQHRQMAVRRGAIQAIGRLGTREHLPAVRDMLSDPEAHVREAAVEAIGGLGTREDLPALCDKLRRESVCVRAAAARALGRLGTGEDLPLLHEMVSDREGAVRAGAAEAIGRLEGVPALRQMLSDPESDMGAPAHAIARVATRKDLATLREMLRSGYSGAQVVAARAIGRVGTHEDLPALRKMLGDPDPYVLSAAALAIGHRGTVEDLLAMREMLTRGRTWFERAAAARAIARLGTLEDLAALRKLCRDLSPEMRATAVEAIGRLGTEDDLDMLARDLGERRRNEEGFVSALVELDRTLYCQFDEFKREEEDEDYEDEDEDY